MPGIETEERESEEYLDNKAKLYSSWPMSIREVPRGITYSREG
jgi:hypothetical protein